MAMACDGVTTYQSGGAGGKLRKKPIRRNSPYNRLPISNNQPSLFSKLMNPASRLIYAGADRLFSVFRKRLPHILVQSLPGTSEEPRNGSQEAGPAPVSNNGIVVLEPNTDEGEEIASISAATEISELENMLKQKTFTRSEIELLTALLHSRTTEADIEGNSAKLPKHDVATPAELAKAYMGTKSAKLPPLAPRPSCQPSRQDPVLLNNTTILPKTPVISLTPKPAATFKTFDSCLTTPRSQGRSAFYKNARSPYYRGPSTLSQKGMASLSALEHGGSIESSRMGAKRRSFVIDDTGFGEPVRRIRQKVNLQSQQSSISKHKSEFGQDSGGKPSFMFGSGTPSMVPFQFGGQTNQPQTPSQNPFQASAGSFLLGGGGSVKSDRRILKVKRLSKRK